MINSTILKTKHYLQPVKGAVSAFFEQLEVNYFDYHTSHTQLFKYSFSGYFSVVGESIISNDGGISFDLEKLTLWQVIKSEDTNQLHIILQFKDTSYLKIYSSLEQSQKFWNIIRSLDLDANEVEQRELQLPVNAVCKCCEQRKEYNSEYILEHPVSKIITNTCLRYRTSEISIQSKDSMGRLSLEEPLCEFRDGACILVQNNGDSLMVDIASVHCVKINQVNQDGEDYSSLKIYNSFGDKYFELQVPDKKAMKIWHENLEALRQST